MAYFRCGGGGVPASVKTDMNAVLNKKFGTSTDYPPADWAPTVNLMGPLPEKTQASASVCSFSDGADDVPTKSLVVTIPPTLSGVSVLNEKQTGRNLFDKSTVTANTWIVVNDTTTESTVGYRTSGYIPVKANTKYFVTAKSSNRSAYYDRNKNGIAYFSFSGGASFTCLYDGYIRITIKDDIDLNTFIVNEGNEAIAYEPFGTTYTASLGRTIYGGQADIVNGEGKEWGRIELGSLTWTKVTSGQAPYFASSALNPSYRYVNNNPNALVEGYTQASIGGSGTANGFFITDGSSVRIRDDNYTSGTANEFKEAMSGKYVVYELSTPTDFTFDGQEITTRLGYNAFWSDEGDTEVTYRADIDLLLGGN